VADFVPNPKLGRGLTFAVTAYGLWGVLPLYFLLLAPLGAPELVSWRIVLALVFCVILLTVTRGWAAFVALVRNPRIVLTMGAASVFILVNWSIYIFATLTGHVVEASLGYFTNPIVTVLLGVIVLKERLRVLQWVAIGVSAVAVLVLAINYGQFPWIALILAFSFGAYGLIKKQVGGQVGAISGLTLETAWLAVPAAIALVVIAASGNMVVGTVSTVHTLLVLGLGAVTAIPLLMFAAAARRLPLTYLGLTQYLAPILQFIIGVVVLREEMPTARWLGFGLVWVALIVLTIDVFGANRRSRSITVAPAPA
jgi:chloramphenicol-sensitive protein RarD